MARHEGGITVEDLQTHSSRGLIVSTIIVGVLTAGVLPLLVSDSPKTLLPALKFEYDSIWGFCARMWWFASLFATFTLGVLLNGKLLRAKGIPDEVRSHDAYGRATSWMIFLTVLVVVTLIASLVLPHMWYATSVMKVAAVVIAATFMFIDGQLSSAFASHQTTKAVGEFFHTTMRTIDRPILGAMIATTILAFLYPRLLGNCDFAGTGESGPTFALGLSSGAVATELLIANLAYWAHTRGHISSRTASDIPQTK
jgi:hypothetical protein